MLVLFSDTDSDLSPKIAEKYGYRIISMPYSIDDRTIYPYEDFDEFDSHAYYDMLRSGIVPMTSAINKDKYLNYFEPFFANGDDILYVHFSKAMSATFDSMDMALKDLKAKYPERKFYQIDTKAITTASLVFLLEIGQMYREGKCIEEILDWANKEIDHYAVYFFVDDLKFLMKSGRVSGLAGTVGTLLGVRPIIHMNAEGRMVSIGKEKGRTKAIARLVNYVKELGDEIEKHYILIGHGDAPELCEEVKKCLTEAFPDKNLNIQTVVINPTAGAHCGPNAVGVVFHSIHR